VQEEFSTWTEVRFCPEQMARLCVTELGEPLPEDSGCVPEANGTASLNVTAPQANEMDPAFDGPEPVGVGALPPPWVLGEIEWPECKEEFSTWTELRFCPEQMARLCVTDLGEPLPKDSGCVAETNGTAPLNATEIG
jgi:hypothetical protein